MMPVPPVLRDCRGVTAIEFAIVAPVLMLLLCGTMELGHTMYARAVLEGAVVAAARDASSSMEVDEASRVAIMQDSVKKTMAVFTTAPGKSITIRTVVYADFTSAYPETFTDANKNGKYDLGESYVDRNKNGKWDAATPKAGTLGGPGDVVSYTVTFPKQIMFDWVGRSLGWNGAQNLAATTVMRNETVVRRTML